MAINRADKGKFIADNIDPTLCTHLVVRGPFNIEAEGTALATFTDLAIDEKESLDEMKKNFPHLKVKLCI